MNVEALSSNATVSAILASQPNLANPTASQLAADRQTLADSVGAAPKKAGTTSPADVKKAASQFEAIILRQLLAPSMEPIMSGGMGGNSHESGGGIYGYMLTDVMATSLSKGGGLGLAKLLEKQFSAAHSAADKVSNSASKTQNAPSLL